MPAFDVPMDSPNNPFYIPEVPAETYINSLRDNLKRPARPTNRHSRSHGNAENFNSFSQILNETLVSDESYEEETDSVEIRLPKNIDINKLGVKRRRQSSFHRSQLEYEIELFPTWTAQGSQESATVLPPQEYADYRKHRLSRHKSSIESFSDMQGPNRREKSFEKVHDSSSFNLDRKAVTWDCIMHSFPDDIKSKHRAEKTAATVISLHDQVLALRGELYGHPIGSESPRSLGPLVDCLDAVLPGIRLKERLQGVKSHQQIADFLGKHGYLNPRILNILRPSEIRCLALSNSLIDENGLNMSGKDTLSVFSKPNSFLFLCELTFNNTPIDNFDIVHINNLPRLETLNLNDTTIGNEAVYLLIPLKRSLTILSIAANPKISNNAVSALLMLSKLGFLCIIDTGIGMPGLRELAVAIDEGRPITVQIPFECETYIDNLETQYLTEPRPPLIQDPELAFSLSKAALSRNLTAHAKVNPDIAIAGAKREMAERLKALLEMRLQDRLVMNMLTDSSSDSSG